MAPDRISFFEEFLKKKPDDDFAQYALAMEYAKAGRHDEALETFSALITRSLNYSAGYFQSALLLQKLGRIEAAKERLREGIAAAARANDAHARREMQGVLDDLESQDG
jgi:thioredoxin-like negative regulator of GroEL